MKQTHLVDKLTSVAVVTLVVAFSLCHLPSCSESATAKDEDKALVVNIQKYGNQLVKGTFSFLNTYSYPPETEAEQKALCKSQSDAFKFMREQTKGAPSIVRRGFLTFVSSRQPHYRKYCTNTSSEAGRKFLAASKCLREKKFNKFRDIESNLAQTVFEIARRNYTDPSIELKRICCSFHVTKTNFFANIAPECSEHREIIEELLDEVFGRDTKIVCDDDDKLEKLCPKLPPLQFKRIANFTPPGGRQPAGVVIYLIATLGEPNDPAIISGPVN